jgi:predicted dienelactone hydrolase
MRYTIRTGRLVTLLIVLTSLLAAGWIERNNGSVRSDALFQVRREAKSDAHLPADCGGTLNIGFRIKTFGPGLRGAVWYPTTTAESSYSYPGRYSTSLALDAPVADCGQRFPLVVFSHGFGGCSVQSMFFTEALARAGYIVAAPDHRDSMCKVDRPLRINWAERVDMPTKQHNYSDSSYRDRQQDIKTVLDDMLRDGEFSRRIDVNRIAGAGHSLGGYTILGMAGARPSWKDGRIKAALLLSPFLTPYLANGGLRSVHIPLMYQGGTRDFTITPDVNKPGGAYELSNPPKYFVEFKGAGHLDWSNLVCLFHKYIPGCAASVATPRLINSYGIAFLNRYIKGTSEPILDQPDSQLADLRHSD